MIKYLKMTTSRAESPGLNSIKGYDSVRNGLMLQIRLIQADWLSQFGQVIPGFVLIGKKHHGKHFMVETFLNAIDKRTFTISRGDSAGTVDDLKSFLRGGTQAELSIIIMDGADQMKDDQIELISEVINKAGKPVYILAIAEEENEQVKLCRICGLIDHTLPVNTPFLTDTKQFLDYLIFEKYGHETFDMNMEDLLSVTYRLTFAEVDQILLSGIVSSRNEKANSISEKQIMNAVMRRYYVSDSEALIVTDKKSLETSIHEAGHAIIAELTQKGSAGFASVWLDGYRSPLGFTSVIREDIGFKGCKDEILVSLAGIAAEELCLGRISPGGSEDLQKVITSLATLVGKEACYGLEYIDHYIIRSAEFQSKYDSMIRNLLLQAYAAVKERLAEYEDCITAIATILTQDGYVLGSVIRSIMDK